MSALKQHPVFCKLCRNPGESIAGDDVVIIWLTPASFAVPKPDVFGLTVDQIERILRAAGADVSSIRTSLNSRQRYEQCPNLK
jgi:beta-lactam-binding protein with PASTA domain